MQSTGNNHEGSIPFTRSIDNQGLTNQCSKSAVKCLQPGRNRQLFAARGGRSLGSGTDRFGTCHGHTFGPHGLSSFPPAR